MARLEGPAADVLARLESLVGDAAIGVTGVAALREIVAGAAAAGVPA